MPTGPSRRSLLLAAAALPAAAAPAGHVVFYGDASRVPAATWRRFGTAFLQPVRAGIAAARAGGCRVYGYVSLGEVNRTSPYAELCARRGLTVGANPDWPDALVVDVRKPQWAAVALAMVRDALDAGADGILVDTVDTAAAGEARRPGSAAAAAALVRRVCAAVPGGVVMNRGYDVLPATATALAGVMAEELVAHAGRLRPAEDVAWAVGRLSDARRRNGALGLYGVEYWNTADARGMRKVREASERLGVRTYVATRALDRIVAQS